MAKARRRERAANLSQRDRGLFGIARGALLFDPLGAGGHRGPRAGGAEETLLDVVEGGGVGFALGFGGAATAQFEFGDGGSPGKR